ncbi:MULTISPECIES: sensor domain-containing diguanylate cyclase [unclassified Beijerinckia]|uniref:sensor domain-containing diguanylate cyclase n=1 Tax=unclassified Beijerinckia TaxID=2638183 RepID=UPI000897F04F|nr:MULTISPECIES: sensor domain-containing diguanylate cyclase [unclassified Beijerinckia]MDH7793990.1 diguanylate cyclase (GGDEF)-like protein [Beijerinckia sp. GAS462]SEB50898.1 diguanylate cyclase (GGDEF) domain-containing protein [Beijerinckia sp. 28-YEA-48]
MSRGDDAEMFDLAPVSLWLEDYSGLRLHFDALRARGISDLRAYLRQDREHVRACSALLRIIKVNRKTLSLFEAPDLDTLTANIERVFRDDMFDAHVEELAQLWDGHPQFYGTSVNYSLSGRRIDIQLKGSVLPGYENSWQRVLVAIEDVTDRETARRDLTASEAYARGLFAHSPVSLWVEDFSSIRRLLEEVRFRGITDFRVFTDVHPEFVERCMSEIRVVDINQQTLQLFGAPDKTTLLHRLDEVFRDDMRQNFREQLIDLWDGKLFQQREVLNYALDGTEIHFYMQFSVLPGHEKDWSLVQVALTDITARKKAEAYLEYLGKHDVLTKLYNRSFYVDELHRLERKGPTPVTIVIIDLDGLKIINDQLGHSAGDTLLARIGEVLSKLVEKPSHAARIGGDEFAVLLPGADEAVGQKLMDDIHALVELNNQYYGEPRLSLSMGAATSHPGERLEATIKRADDCMYETKRTRYTQPSNDRRRHSDHLAP